MTPHELPPRPEVSPALHSELLLLPSGQILVHNLTQPMALVLHELNPHDAAIQPRAETKLAPTAPNRQIVT